MTDFYESDISGYGKNSLADSDRHYVSKFWLDVDVLIKRWADVLERSFVITGENVSIAPTRSLDIEIGGVLFAEEDFEQFRHLAMQSGATSFAIIEDVGQQNWKRFEKRSFFRFSYPLNIQWNEMASSCAIASDIFLRPIRAYFVVTDNGTLGKYANNDVDRPYDLIFGEKI